MAHSALVNAGPRLSRLWWFSGPVLFVLVGMLVIVGAMRVPYVTLAPGGARSVEPLVTIESKPGGPAVAEQPASDDLLFVTVSTVIEPSGVLALLGWYRDTVQVEPSEPFLGTQSPEETRALNLAKMTDSQDKARKVALERLGYTVDAIAEGAFLEDVDPDFPAADQLAPGMTVVGADGTEVDTRDDLVDAIGVHAPGDTMVLEVQPLDETDAISVTVTLGSRPGAPDQALLGVTPVDRVRYEFPVDIAIDSGRVGGPSAGLAFTVAILDRMTPGDLLGDERVAVTGTIELDGSVGRVGGVRHKTEAAIAEGATVFLVPPDEEATAIEVADGRLEVRAVSSLDEALAALEDLGGSGLPPVGS